MIPSDVDGVITQEAADRLGKIFALRLPLSQTGGVPRDILRFYRENDSRTEILTFEIGEKECQ